MYEAHFRCPVKFKANQNSLVFSNADMELPFVTHNADLLASVAPQLEAELAGQLAEKTFSEQAKAILKQMLAGHRPGIQDLARELHLSTRTLQRRLTEQDLTFQRLLDEARRELARHYLLQSSRELNETAYLLGYEDANSFFRAFHHWEGTSPGQWRMLQNNPGQLRKCNSEQTDVSASRHARSSEAALKERGKALDAKSHRGISKHSADVLSRTTRFHRPTSKQE
jgi:AraC-like DNA-binding protein